MVFNGIWLMRLKYLLCPGYVDMDLDGMEGLPVTMETYLFSNRSTTSAPTQRFMV